MGQRYGIPKELVLNLAKAGGAEIFIETGTFKGKTTRWAAGHFTQVFTIERAEGLFQLQSESLRSLGNVTPLLGDSRVRLPEVLKLIGDKPAVFWLDGHWSGGVTAGENDECPLTEELHLLASRKNDIVLIDDARYMLSTPPPACKYEQWPTITQIVDDLRAGGNNPLTQIIDDVIISVPDSAPYASILRAYAQRRSLQIARSSYRGLQARAKNFLAKLLRW